ncbi:MAG: glycoside hydrolase family 3 protein [Chloroflexi bacterium OHK40]
MLEHMIGARLLLSFAGTEAPNEVLARIATQRPAGVTLFRHANAVAPAQVRALNAALQRAARAAGLPALLICADQEGGQLQAVAGLTPFPGNLALGAVGDADLARRVGIALGRELAAVGVNVNYAPVCDVNVNPANPVIGARAFGEEPALVARLAAALVDGLQAAGVAATAKHFPGHGDTAADSHHALPTLPHDQTRMDAVELAPFRAAISAGVRLVMSAHLAVPALTGDPGLPATLAAPILRDLLRGRLGFEGVVVSDSLAMAAVTGGASLPETALRAALAGVDLLLLQHSPAEESAVYERLLAAARIGMLDPTELAASAARVARLQHRAATQSQPDLEVIGCANHRALAAEVARRAITLVHDQQGLLPLRLPADARVAVVVPQPADLTPADTSSYEQADLAGAVRRFHSGARGFSVPADPTPSDIAQLRVALAGYELAIVATINAWQQPGQAALVQALLTDGVPTVVAALRLPYDLGCFPEARTFVAAYSLLPPSLDALAAALWGMLPFAGRLPVSVPGIYPAGHRAELSR